MNYFSLQNKLRGLGALVATSLIIAFVAEYGFKLLPCELCLLQRIPAYIAVAIALVGGIPALMTYNRLFLLLFAVACFATAAIAGYHTGIEQRWWAGPSSCSGDGISGALLSLEELRSQIMGAPIIRCDKPAFEMLGITMASANFVFSAIIGSYALLQAAFGKEVSLENE